jgi:hypothetical protein
MSVIKTKLENIKNDIENAIKVGLYQSSNLIILVLEQDEILAFQTLGFDSPAINLSKILSEQLIVMSMKDRIKSITALINKIVNDCGSVCNLDRVNVLFEESLAQDPIKLLHRAAKKKPIIVLWPGDINESSLSYSKPGYPDYKNYKLNELQDVQVITTCKQGVSK